MTALETFCLLGCSLDNPIGTAKTDDRSYQVHHHVNIASGAGIPGTFPVVHCPACCSQPSP